MHNAYIRTNQFQSIPVPAATGQGSPAGLQIKTTTLNAFSCLIAAGFVLVMSIVTFTVSTLFGIIATFTMTLLLCLMLPAATPALLIIAFMFQNMTIAFFIPLMADNSGFDAVRGVNFVILLTAMSAFIIAAFLHADRLPRQTKSWILIALAMASIVVLYLVLGAVRGDVKDATIYFRNTITPLACFLIGLSVASMYTTHIRQILLVLGLAAVSYGYAEFIFTINFLSLFNGDEYFRLRLASQIDSGYWDRVMEQTGFVLRSLEDVMLVPFLNLHFFDEWFPRMFRLSGPNIHPISYAYSLAVISAWMLFNHRSWFLALSLPLLIIIGSKGALVLMLSAICLKYAVKIFGLKFSVISMILALSIYISAAIIYGRTIGDYHVLGFLAGVRDFLYNPLGQGLGFGGNLSSSIENVLSWSRAQQQGIADIPVESALGVMLYQMGIAAIVYFAILMGIARTCYAAFVDTGAPKFLFAIAAIATIVTNSVLQEEAVYSPLALGLTLLLVGIALGEHWRQQKMQTHPNIQTHPVLRGAS